MRIISLVRIRRFRIGFEWFSSVAELRVVSSCPFGDSNFRLRKCSSWPEITCFMYQTLWAGVCLKHGPRAWISMLICACLYLYVCLFVCVCVCVCSSRTGTSFSTNQNAWWRQLIKYSFQQDRTLSTSTKKLFHIVSRVRWLHVYREKNSASWLGSHIYKPEHNTPILAF